MKLKHVYFSIVLIFMIVGLVVWKLNDMYKVEKSAAKQNQIQTQLTSLRTTLAGQLSQLRNTLSAYTVQIDESKINWIQLKPFYALALVQEDAANRISVVKMFSQSGSVSERWNQASLQQMFIKRVKGNQLLRGEIIQDPSALKHLVLTFFDKEKRDNMPRTGVMVIGDVSYFQRFFDLQRTSQVTQVLLTADQMVTAHSEFDYVGNISDEAKISEKKFFIENQELRGTNFNLLSYSLKKADGQLNIPMPIFGLIVGLGFLISGILVFLAKADVISAVPSVPVRADVKVSVSPSKQFAVMPPPVPSPVMKSKPVATVNVPVAKKPIAPPLPLVLGEEAISVPVQIQACVQQAIFNMDRAIKSNGVSISKEFVSGEMLQLDYPKFVKIFENILANFVETLSVKSRKKISIRTYDADNLTILEIQADVNAIKLHEAIFPELEKATCELVESKSSGGESIYKFIFTRSVQKAEAKLPPPLPVKSSMPPKFNIPADDIVISPADLDIESLLSLDAADDNNNEIQASQNETPQAAKVDLEKEMQTSKFKLDNMLSIIEDPKINIEINKDQQADQFKVKIRRPSTT